MVAGAARMWLASATGTQPSFSDMRSPRLAFGHIIHAYLPSFSGLTKVVQGVCGKSCVYTPTTTWHLGTF
jgi:hypothetical protein